MKHEDALFVALVAVVILSVVIIGGYMWLVSHIGFLGIGL